jgi:hypothetical protein
MSSLWLHPLPGCALPVFNLYFSYSAVLLRCARYEQNALVAAVASGSIMGIELPLYRSSFLLSAGLKPSKTWPSE